MANFSSTQAIIKRRSIEIMQRAAQDVLEKTQRAAPVRSGALRDAIYVTQAVQSGSSCSFTIAIDPSQERVANFVIFGTGPHPIDPHGPYPLRWDASHGGYAGRTYHVDHPGTSANDFFFRLMDRRFLTALEKAVRQS